MKIIGFVKKESEVILSKEDMIINELKEMKKFPKLKKNIYMKVIGDRIVLVNISNPTSYKYRTYGTITSDGSGGYEIKLKETIYGSRKEKVFKDFIKYKMETRVVDYKKVKTDRCVMSSEEVTYYNEQGLLTAGEITKLVPIYKDEPVFSEEWVAEMEGE